MTFCPFNGYDDLKRVATVCIGGGRFLVIILRLLVLNVISSITII
jgi:hypothetical protein